MIGLLGTARLLKALGDETRMRILNLLGAGGALGDGSHGDPERRAEPHLDPPRAAQGGRARRRPARRPTDLLLDRARPGRGLLGARARGEQEHARVRDRLGRPRRPARAPALEDARLLRSRRRQLRGRAPARTHVGGPRPRAHAAAPARPVRRPRRRRRPAHAHARGGREPHDRRRPLDGDAEPAHRTRALEGHRQHRGDRGRHRGPAAAGRLARRRRREPRPCTTRRNPSAASPRRTAS